MSHPDTPSDDRELRLIDGDPLALERTRVDMVPAATRVGQQRWWNWSREWNGAPGYGPEWR